MTAGLVTLCVAIVIIVYVGVGMMRREAGLFGRVHLRAPIETNRVALTFDDGPNFNSTDRVLDILKRENVPATFFVIGRNAAGAPALLKRIVDEGHQIANHSFDHHHVGFMRGLLYWHEQLTRTNKLIADATGHRPAMFRPPIGISSPVISLLAKRMKLAIVLWSVRSRDGTTSPKELIVARVTNSVRGGDIIVLHDGIDPHHWRDPSGTLEALPEIIAHLRQKGLQPVRLDELLGLPAYVSSVGSG